MTPAAIIGASVGPMNGAVSEKSSTVAEPNCASVVVLVLDAGSPMNGAVSEISSTVATEPKYVVIIILTVDGNLDDTV